MNLQFQEPLAVREVSPDLVKKTEGQAFIPKSKSQNLIQPKDYTSTHARRQRDIKRLLDSKQGTVQRAASWERTGPQAQHQGQREERDVSGGKALRPAGQDGMVGAVLPTQAKVPGLLNSREGELARSSGAEAESDLRPILKVGVQPHSPQHLRALDQVPSTRPIAKQGNQEHEQWPREEPASKESASDLAPRRGPGTAGASTGGLLLQGRQFLGPSVPPTNQKGMLGDTKQWRHRSRDQGTMSGGLNEDLSGQVSKARLQRREIGLL